MLEAGGHAGEVVTDLTEDLADGTLLIKILQVAGKWVKADTQSVEPHTPLLGPSPPLPLALFVLAVRLPKIMTDWRQDVRAPILGGLYSFTTSQEPPLHVLPTPWTSLREQTLF